MGQPAVLASVNVGNVRLGSSASQAITIGNTNISPAGFQEGLNANVGSTSGGATGSGSITNLAAGATSNAINVGLNVSGAGAQSGTVTLNLASNGALSGLSDLSLGTTNVNVQATGFRLANPVITTPAVTLAARVGDVSPSAGISVINSSPDPFTEGLNVTRGATPPGFTSSGSITNLTAGNTSAGPIQVALNTATAGSFSGSEVLDFVSTGAGTTGAPDVSVGSGNVSLTGRVYTPAVAQLNTPAVNLGIMHVGDGVTTQGVSVTNGAAVTALNDVLRAAFTGATGPFIGSGTLGDGLGAQQNDSTSLRVGLTTGTAGIFSGTATFSAASHNAELADAALPNVEVALTGQVYNFAQDAFSFGGGAGTFSRAGSTFMLDFGTLFQGSGTLLSTLFAGNSALGPADLLDGSFSFLDLPEFAESGFNPFFDLAAGQNTAPLQLSFDTDDLGSFSDTILLHGLGHNASGFSAPIGDIALVVRGTVITRDASVPEPAAFALMLAGMLIFAAVGLRRRIRAR